MNTTPHTFLLCFPFVLALFSFLLSCLPAEPYLESEYGGEFGREAPIKLLDKLLHSWKEFPDQEVRTCTTAPCTACTLLSALHPLAGLPPLLWLGSAGAPPTHSPLWLLRGWFLPLAPMQVVVVNQVLACNATLGYEDTFNTQASAPGGCPAPARLPCQAWQQALQASLQPPCRWPAVACGSRRCCPLRLGSRAPTV